MNEEHIIKGTEMIVTSVNGEDISIRSNHENPNTITIDISKALQEHAIEFGNWIRRNTIKTIHDDNFMVIPSDEYKTPEQLYKEFQSQHASPK